MRHHVRVTTILKVPRKCASKSLDRTYQSTEIQRYPGISYIKNEEVEEYNPLCPNIYEHVVRDHLRSERTRMELARVGKKRSRFDDLEDEEPEGQQALMLQLQKHLTRRWEAQEEDYGLFISKSPKLKDIPALTEPPTYLLGQLDDAIAAETLAKYGFEESHGFGKRKRELSTFLPVWKTPRMKWKNRLKRLAAAKSQMRHEESKVSGILKNITGMVGSSKVK